MSLTMRARSARNGPGIALHGVRLPEHTLYRATGRPGDRATGLPGYLPFEVAARFCYSRAQYHDII